MLLTQYNGCIERKSKQVFPELSTNTTFTITVLLDDKFSEQIEHQRVLHTDFRSHIFNFNSIYVNFV